MASIHLFAEERLGWCTGADRYHFRYLVGALVDNGNKFVCRECLHYLKSIGAKVINPNAATNAAPKKSMVRSRKVKKARTKKVYLSKEEVKRRILKYLSTGFFSYLEIYEEVDHRLTFSTMLIVLCGMRRSKEITCIRDSSRGNNICTTTERRELLERAFGDNHQSALIRLFRELKEVAIIDAARGLGRPRPTVASWVRKLEKDGMLQCRVTSRRGKKGKDKVCKISWGQEPEIANVDYVVNRAYYEGKEDDLQDK